MREEAEDPSKCVSKILINFYGNDDQKTFPKMIQKTIDKNNMKLKANIDLATLC